MSEYDFLLSFLIIGASLIISGLVPKTIARFMNTNLFNTGTFMSIGNMNNNLIRLQIF